MDVDFIDIHDVIGRFRIGHLESEILRAIFGPLRVVGPWMRKPGIRSLFSTNMADNMADGFLPTWPIILNKSLERSEVHRLLGQSHKVRGIIIIQTKEIWSVVLDSKYLLTVSFHV